MIQQTQIVGGTPVSAGQAVADDEDGGGLGAAHLGYGDWGQRFAIFELVRPEADKFLVR